LDLDHTDILEFITTNRRELPWVKRCVDLTPEMWDDASDELRESLLYGIKSGDIWLNKIKYAKHSVSPTKKGERIYGNVCLEVYLPSRGTCLLQHVNLSACSIEDLGEAFFDGMSQLCDLHGRTGVGESGEYLPSTTDRQVGLGMLGLANLLRRYEVTYAEFGEALEQLNKSLAGMSSPTAWSLAFHLRAAIHQAAQVAKWNKMDRAFCIAPTASCSYRSTDKDGYTATPEIAPPISRKVDRDSGTFGVESYDYGDVEIASEVGWDAYKKVADNIMIMLNNTGLLHGYSFNSWSDVVTYDNAFVEEWLASPQTSLYYSLQVMGDTQDKSNVYAALDESSVEDYLADILNNKQPDCNCQE